MKSRNGWRASFLLMVALNTVDPASQEDLALFGFQRRTSSKTKSSLVSYEPLDPVRFTGTKSSSTGQSTSIMAHEEVFELEGPNV